MDGSVGKEEEKEEMDGNDAGAERLATEAMEERLRVQLRQPLALPVGFKDRLLARVAEGEPSVPAGHGIPVAVPVPSPPRAGVLPFRRPAVLRAVAGGALAASILAGTFGVELERRHLDRQQAAQRLAAERAMANEQFDQASRITDEALAHTREQLERAGVFEQQGR